MDNYQCQYYWNNKTNNKMEEIKLICIIAEKFPINEIGPKLVLDQEYPLESKFKCNCGEEHFNVGLQMEINYVECYKCREKLPEDIHWCHSSRFKSKVEQPYTTGNE